jgi:broad specificity phosphatase PhoE
MTKIYIIRHGETEWNIQKRLQGQKDSPLTKQGLEQAKERAKSLAQVPFEEVFSSDLVRAQRTAGIIALEHQLTAKTHQLLRERSFGKHEGKLITEFEEELKEMLLKEEALNKEERFAFKISDDIESDEEITTRMLTALREIAVAYPDKTVGVICHGAIMRTLLIHLGWGTYTQLQHGAIENLGYFVVDTDGVDFFISEAVGVKVIDQTQKGQ